MSFFAHGYTRCIEISLRMRVLCFQVTQIPRAAGMKTSEDEVTGIYTPSGSMEHES